MHTSSLFALLLDDRGFGGTAGPDLSRYMIVVGILVAAIVAIAIALPRLVRGTTRARAARRHLAVIDVLPLGGKRQLSVVRCYDRTFALGVGEREVALIAEIDPAHTEDEEGDEPDQEFLRLFDVARERLGSSLPRRTRRRESVEAAVEPRA
ncbi:MAG: flagellar biosynthetic protein FliO [bacterium]|nr:flagellar biosynthetic protein FliO [bacterium]